MRALMRAKSTEFPSGFSVIRGTLQRIEDACQACVLRRLVAVWGVPIAPSQLIASFDQPIAPNSKLQ